MTRTLLRAGKSPFQVVGPENTAYDVPAGIFGRNVGNLVFSDSMHRILSVPNAEVLPDTFLGERYGVTYGYIDRLNNEFDHYVIPLANAFRDDFIGHLKQQTATIRKLKIPVTVVGVGVAGGAGSLTRSITDVSGNLKSAVKEFVNAVLDKSATIGVRGENSRSFLKALGYGDDVVDVIGCPSLFRNGEDQLIEKGLSALNDQSKLSINISPYVPYMADCSLYHAAKYPNLLYIPQDFATLEMMLWGKSIPGGVAEMPTNIGHPLYKSNRMRFFVDSRPWIAHLEGQDFSFGTRIHGNIAALVAKTPAVVLVHDTRTQELVDFHQIPFRNVTDLPKNLDAAELYQEADYTDFNRGHLSRFENFKKFLSKNGVASIFEPGNANPTYDTQLAALELPGPVNCLPTDGDIISRIQWLKSRLPRTSKQDYRFKAPVPHSQPTVRDLPAMVSKKLGGNDE